MSTHLKCKISILIADDHAITRAGIRAILSKALDMEIVGEAKNGDEIKELVEKLRPRILLLDLIMPDLSPAKLEKWVRENYPDIVTLVLTAHDRDVYLADMMDAGAKGFMHKDVRAEQLINAIRRAASGENLFDETQVSRVGRWRRDIEEKWNSLTDRELQILHLLVDGMSNRRIAVSMALNPKTVEQHLTNIYDKIGVTSRTEAVLWAISQSRGFPD